MNEVIEHVSERASSLALITNEGNMSRVMSMAKMMASSKVTVPKHLLGSEGDCAAIVIQAANWGMNPFAVAQKTHLVNGVLGYEAQLVNAVIQSSNSIKGAFNYEYKEEGGTGVNAFVTCRVGAVLNGHDKITWGEWLASASVITKNSPLWKSNVKQQMGYLQVKNWARLYCPGAIMGVYTQEELEDNPPAEVDITAGSTKVEDPVYVLDADFVANSAKWEKAIKAKTKTVADLIVWIESKGALLTADQKVTIESWLPQEPAIVENPSQNDFAADYNTAESKSE